MRDRSDLFSDDSRGLDTEKMDGEIAIHFQSMKIACLGAVSVALLFTYGTFTTAPPVGGEF